jgi:hypothetical protein
MLLSVSVPVGAECEAPLRHIRTLYYCTGVEVPVGRIAEGGRTNGSGIPKPKPTQTKSQEQH